MQKKKKKEICGKRILKKFANDKNYQKVRDHCHFTGKYRDTEHLKFNVANKIPAVFHKGSNYDYHFIIKKLTNQLEGEFECLGSNTEKYKTFFVAIEKELTNIGQNSNESETLQNKIFSQHKIYDKFIIKSC